MSRAGPSCLDLFGEGDRGWVGEGDRLVEVILVVFGLMDYFCLGDFERMDDDGGFNVFVVEVGFFNFGEALALVIGHASVRKRMMMNYATENDKWI